MDALREWYRIVESRDSSGLPRLFAEDAIFLSPVLHRPQVGRDRCVTYVDAAIRILDNQDFRYIAEFRGEHAAVLEFESRYKDVYINGVDILTFDETDTRIVQFKVMLRPAKAIDTVMVAMMQYLNANGG